MAYDSWCAAATNIGYTGTSTGSINTSSFATTVSSFSSNSEYNGPAFYAPGSGINSNNQVSGRVVSWGLRIRYRGSELNRGGHVTLFEEPEHNDLTKLNAAGGGINETTALAFENAQQYPIPADGSWLYVTGLPVFPWEFDYSDTSLGYDFSATTSGGYPPAYLCAFLTSAVAAQNFDFEVFMNLELIGGAVRGKTPSHFDAPGAMIAIEGVRKLAPGPPGGSAGVSREGSAPRSRNKGFLDRLSEFALSTVSGVLEKVPVVGNVMKLLA
jgi:hypothetical protein